MDIIYIHDLRIDTVIGVFDWERRVRQTVILDLDMATDIRRAAATDALSDTLKQNARYGRAPRAAHVRSTSTCCSTTTSSPMHKACNCRAPRSCATPSYWGRWPRSRANGVIRRTAGVTPNYGQTSPTRPRSRCGPSRSMWLDAMRPARAGIPRTT